MQQHRQPHKEHQIKCLSNAINYITNQPTNQLSKEPSIHPTIQPQSSIQTNHISKNARKPAAAKLAKTVRNSQQKKPKKELHNFYRFKQKISSWEIKYFNVKWYNQAPKTVLTFEICGRCQELLLLNELDKRWPEAKIKCRKNQNPKKHSCRKL